MGRYDPARVARLEYELFGIPIPLKFRTEEEPVSNEEEWDRLLRDNDMEDE